MKAILFLLLLIPSVRCWAYSCPSASPEDQRIHQWLSRFQGQMDLGECRIEIILCNPNDVRPGSSPLAEILITDSFGREIYAPIYSQSQSHPNLKVRHILNRRMFHYEYKDLFFEQEEGRTEVYRLELRTKWNDTTDLEQLDLGKYSTNKGRSIWYNCGVGH